MGNPPVLSGEEVNTYRQAGVDRAPNTFGISTGATDLFMVEQGDVLVLDGRPHRVKHYEREGASGKGRNLIFLVNQPRY